MSWRSGKQQTIRELIMDELARVISGFDSIETLVAEIRAGEETIKTVEELVEYLESELGYSVG